MQFKKFALRGMIILAIVIALCVLFSGTLRTLTTAKVRFAPKKMGKLEQSVELENGKVVFPDQKEITLRVPEGLSLTVSKVHVINGQKVKAGAVLLSTEVTNVEEKLDELQKEYDDARSKMDDWQRKNGDIRLSRGEQLWRDAYNAAREAERTELNLRLSLMTELGVSKASKLTEKTVSKGSEEAQKLYAEWQTAVDEMGKAQNKQAELNRYAIAEDVWKTLQEEQEYEQKQKDAENQMIKIRLLQKQVGQITAPHDGYVIEMKVEKGTVLSGENDLLLFTPENVEPVIRGEIRDTGKPVQKGAEITIVMDETSNKKIKTKVKATGVTETGVACADAEITDDVIYELGSVSTMMQMSKIPMKVMTRSKDSVCLIPASALHEVSGTSAVIYTADTTTNALGENVLRVYQTNVTLLGQSDGQAAIQDEYLFYGGYNVVYMEDRPIKSGDTVMLYDN